MSEATAGVSWAGRRAGAAAGWAAPDARRHLQLGLAAVWLLDGVLQYQSFMFTRPFGQTLAARRPAGSAHAARPARGSRRPAGSAQVRGLQRMVQDDKYCIDILTQVSAVTRALQSVAVGLLEEHLGHCVVQAVAEGGDSAAEKVREASDAIARLVRS
jgi:DNA-binding FrmR family transcriptional regulator